MIDPALIKKALEGFKAPEEADLFIKALEEYVGIGKSKIEDDLRSIDFVEKPVDMYTFMKNPYYLGIIDSIYPKIVDDLIEFFDPGHEYFLGLMGGAIGYGKSTFSEIAIARIIYEVSCLKNPQKTYRMVKEDKLFFANVSVTHTQAKRVIFEGLKGKIKGSEYFRTVFPYQDFATELRFPNNVLLAACTQSQVIGMNTFAAAMDEANFMPIVERSQTARLRGGKRLYDQAEVVFTALLRRMETRYLRFGNLPGKLMALSSAQYPDDFMERKMALYQGNKNVFIRNYAVWDTKPEGTYSNEKFFVFFNKESGLGRIPKDDETLGEEEERIDIPLEFRHDFEVDMEGSLRDLAGRSTVSIEPFITKREMIGRMYEDNRRHPFSAYETTLRDGAYVLRDVLCEWVKEEDELGHVKFEGLRPKVNPKTRRYIHIDPSISGDSAGFCLGHTSHYEERMRWRTIQVVEPGSLEPKTRREGFVEMLPVIYIDLWLRIVPPPGGEIILGDIRQLIIELKEMGFRFALITMDSFQSKDTQQQLKEKGFNTEELSVDVNPQPYNRLKMALYETRLKGYLHPVGVNELRQLEWNKRKGKIDHRPGGCFTGATRFALLDGTLPTFEELGVRFRENEKFYVYTIGSNGVTVGEASNPRITARDTEIVEVILDNFQVVRCTPTQQFMLTDGSYVEAQNLNCDMRLMPLYRNRGQKGGWLDYEKYFDPVRKQGDLLTHHMVAKWKFGKIPGRIIVHHKDGVKGNNDPGNIWLDDRHEHVRKQTLKRHEVDMGWVEKLRKGHERYRENGGNGKSRENMLRLFREGKLKSGRAKCCIEGCDSLSDAKGMCGKHYQFFRREKTRFQNHRGNHRVLSVKEGGRADVWDITVKNTHNFALASGVFVHNSKDLADSLAGVVHNCETKRVAEPVAPSLGIAESPADEEIKRKLEETKWLLGK